MAPSKFTQIQDETVITQIQKCRAIWDWESTDYKDMNLKEHVWKEVSKNTKKSVADCKKRWKSMRDNYFKIRKGQKMSAGKTRFVKTIKWSLFKYLTFLDNTTPECSSTSSFSQLLSQADWKEEEPQYSIYPEDNSLESNCTIKNEIILLPENSLLKRRLTDTSDSPRCSTAITNGHTNRGCIQEGRSDMFMDPMGNKEKEEDDVESFMKSITFSLKKLSPKKIAQAKMEILSIVTKLEFQEEIFP